MFSKAEPRTWLISTSLKPLALLGGSCFAWYGCLCIWFCTHSCHLPGFPEHFHSPSFCFSLFLPLPLTPPVLIAVTRCKGALVVAVFIQPSKHLPPLSSLQLATVTRPWCLNPLHPVPLLAGCRVVQPLNERPMVL